MLVMIAAVVSLIACWCLLFVVANAAKHLHHAINSDMNLGCNGLALTGFSTFLVRIPRNKFR